MITIKVGPMWNKLSAGDDPSRTVGRILVVPAILGLMIAPTVIFWSPVRIWANGITVLIVFLVLGAISLSMVTGVIRRFMQSREIEIEQLASMLGMLIAIAAGVYMFGIKPALWDDRAKSTHDNNGIEAACNARSHVPGQNPIG